MDDTISFINGAHMGDLSRVVTRNEFISYYRWSTGLHQASIQFDTLSDS